MQDSNNTITFYRVPGWAANYEVSQTRRVEALSWVPVPANLNSGGYLELMEAEDGPEVFGAWLAMIQLLARCNLRGSLIKSNLKPYDSRSIAFATRVPEASIKKMIKATLETGWLEEVTISRDFIAFYVEEMRNYWAKIKAIKALPKVQKAPAPKYPLSDYELAMSELCAKYDSKSIPALLEEREEREEREEKEKKEGEENSPPSAPRKNGPSLEEVKNHFAWNLEAQGGTEALAEEFFNQFNAIGWKKDGSRLDWKYKAGYWIGDKTRLTPGQPRDPINAEILQQALKADNLF